MTSGLIALDPASMAATAGALHAVRDELHGALQGLDGGGIDIPPAVRAELESGIRAARSRLDRAGSAAADMADDLLERARTIVLDQLSGGGGRQALVARFGAKDADYLLKWAGTQLSRVAAAHYAVERFAGEGVRSRAWDAAERLAGIEMHSWQAFRRMTELSEYGRAFRNGRLTRAFKDELANLERLRVKRVEALPEAFRTAKVAAALERFSRIMNSRTVRLGGAALAFYGQYQNSNFKSWYGKGLSAAAGAAITYNPVTGVIDVATGGGASAAPETYWALGSGIYGAATGDKNATDFFYTWANGTYEGHSGSLVAHVNNYLYDHVDLTFMFKGPDAHFEWKPWKW
jgi:hypothetical protein